MILQELLHFSVDILSLKTVFIQEDNMKAEIHPVYSDTSITCACGNVIETKSTKENINVEICSSCHPFFTGKQKFVDTAGRVDKFKKKYKMK